MSKFKAYGSFDPHVPVNLKTNYSGQVACSTKFHETMTKIYFCGSIRGGRELAGLYAEIITLLKSYGTVLTEHVGDREGISNEDELLSDRQIHDRDLQWIRESDLVVAEVTQPSLGVGYEIGRAIEMGKPVLCLYQGADPGKLSAMIGGSGDVKRIDYSRPEELPEVFSRFMELHAPHRTS